MPRILRGKVRRDRTAETEPLDVVAQADRDRASNPILIAPTLLDLTITSVNDSTP